MSNKCIVFEAPEDLRQTVKQYAKEHLTSTSVVCRLALLHFLDTKNRQMMTSNQNTA